MKQTIIFLSVAFLSRWFALQCGWRSAILRPFHIPLLAGGEQLVKRQQNHFASFLPPLVVIRSRKLKRL